MRVAEALVRNAEVGELLLERDVVRLRAVRDRERALREDDREEHVGDVRLLLVRGGAVRDRTAVREARVEAEVDAENVARRVQADVVARGLEVDRVDDVEAVRLERVDGRLRNAEG